MQPLQGIRVLDLSRVLPGTPVEYRIPPPRLGENTAEILNEILGLSSSEVDDLKSRGVI